MKSIIKTLTLILVLALSFSFIACDENEDANTDNYTGYAFEYEIETDDDDNEYVLITGLFVADGTATAVANGDYSPVHLEIGKDNKISVPVYEKDDNGEDKETYENDALKTVELVLGEGEAKNCTYFEIADDAFANQLMLHSITVYDSVKKVGVASFAGCANLEKVTLPYIGNEIGAVNASKVFANIFGTAEAANCTSTAVNYNESGTATYYVPNALKEIVIAYTAESVEIPAYAFYGLTGIEKITVSGNVTKVGKNAFANCSKVYSVSVPASVTEIGKSAFSGCTALASFDFASLTALENIQQEAFKGCTSLGYGKNTVVTMPESLTTLGAKVFYGCTTIKSVDLKNVATIGEAAFYGCTSLKSATYLATANVGLYAFEDCHEDFVANK